MDQGFFFFPPPATCVQVHKPGPSAHVIIKNVGEKGGSRMRNDQSWKTFINLNEKNLKSYERATRELGGNDDGVTSGINITWPIAASLADRDARTVL